jgi:hypothetical protein
MAAVGVAMAAGVQNQLFALGVGGGRSLTLLRRPRQALELLLKPVQLGWVLQQGQEQAAQGGCGGFVAGEQHQQELFCHVVVARQRQGPQQLSHTVGPPALDRIALGEQVADRLATANEDGALP